ncbi:carbohydrate ABC transporter permease [Lachnospiraceae bacterium]|jgi:putative aldouronate transport system permease protein|nr:carbohydrate ABC transporter permease [Lachnospiraceae bacterium]
MLKTRENRRYQILCNTVLALITVYMIFPFVLLLMSSITEENTLIMNGYSLFPEKFSLGAYQYIFQNGKKIFHAYGVTIFVTIVGTAINLWISSMLAFGLSRKNLPFRRIITFYVFFTMLFNGGLVPTYMMYTGTFHIKNTIFAMIVPNLLMSAVNVLLVRTYFTNSIPDALYEAAEIDGAGQMRIYFQVALPLGKPILVTTGLFAALGYWNDWTNGLYYVNQEQFWGIQNLLNKMISDVQALTSGLMSKEMAGMLSTMPSVSVRMAVAFVAMMPVLLVYPFLQKYFAEGIAMGAVKG